MCWMAVAMGISAAASMAMSYRQAQGEKGIAKSQAQAAKTSAALRADDRQRNMESFLGAQRARAGMSGVHVESFSSNYDDTSREFARQNYLDKLQTSLDVQGHEAAGKLAMTKGYGNMFNTATSTGFDISNSLDTGGSRKAT